jgi:hypothetical protein
MNAMTRSREAKVVSLAEIKQRKMIAQYIAFYGNMYDSTRKATK